MTQYLGELAVPTEDPGLVPSIYVVAHSHL